MEDGEGVMPMEATTIRAALERFILLEWVVQTECLWNGIAITGIPPRFEGKPVRYFLAKDELQHVAGNMDLSGRLLDRVAREMRQASMFIVYPVTMPPTPRDLGEC
jgi:hypothetical protein